jgi:hypothetical protein
VVRGSRRILQNPKLIFKNIQSDQKKIILMKKQLFSHEAKILSSLQFNTSRVLVVDFLQYFIVDADIPLNSKMYHYCFYLLNISYMSPKLQSLPKSLLAFSIVYFVSKIFSSNKHWPLEETVSPGKSVLHLSISKNIKSIERHQQQFITFKEKRIGDVSILKSNEKDKERTSLQVCLGEKSEMKFDLSKVKSVSMEIFAGKYLVLV